MWLFPRSGLPFFQRCDQILDGFLAVAEEHQRVVHREQWVRNSRETRPERTLDDDGCPDNRGYFLNLLKYHRLFVRTGRDAEIGDFVKSRDKDDLVSFVLWAGNQINTALNRNGVLLNADTF